MEVPPAVAAAAAAEGVSTSTADQAGGALPLFSFGLLSDIQYADKDNGSYDGRIPRYREATGKLREAVGFFNERAQQLRFVLHLGDIVDGNDTEEKTVSDFEEVQRELTELQLPMRHVLGNHCLALGRERLLKSLDLDKSYYQEPLPSSWRLVVLDSMDLSQGEEYRAQKPLGPDNPNLHTWNGGLAQEQLEWLRQLIADAERNGERLIVCAHHPISTGVAPADHLLWNHKEVSELLEASPATALVLAGHYHVGGYNHVKHVHYVTVQGLVEAPTGNNAYAIVEVYADHIDIKGFGTVPSIQLKLVALHQA
eukprot:jgi/Chlat1/7266/Chrsp58S06899